MNKTILIAASLFALSGCGGGFAVRNTEMFQKDTLPIVHSKDGDILACYDGVLKTSPGAQGHVTVHWTIPKKDEPGGGTLTNVAVDPASTTAPPPVADCVTKNITGIGTLSPKDENEGQGTGEWEFHAPPPPAPAPQS
ncbi:MAG TPA: hypothetical protein VIF62_32700 [Labilithrix sp.]|jgi:hypothetical protein